MIPIRLTITGFLSYKDTVELDFTLFDLACITGPNGAGKSSLLDAFTWALFGKARKFDDSIINSRSSAAEVSLVFSYEGNIYRVQRSKTREKTTILEFQILQPDTSPEPGSSGLPPGNWKTLTEHSLRETDLRIQQTLRMDYETFINASFFLQGKADQFTQQRSGERKRILGSILGLEVWEDYRQRTYILRRRVEGEIATIDGQLREISLELSEESARKARLKQLEADLKRLSEERQNQEAFLLTLRKLADSLAEQQKWVKALARQLEANRAQLEQQQARLVARRLERDQYASLLGRVPEIESAYQARLAILSSLEQFDQVAARFREHEQRRYEPREEIQAERARLEQEQTMLQSQLQETERLAAEKVSLEAQLEAARLAGTDLEAKLAQKDEIEDYLQARRDRWQELNLQNASMSEQVIGLRERAEQLLQVEGAACPLCGQALGELERQALVDSLNQQVLELDQTMAANRLAQEEVRLGGEGFKAQLSDLSDVERQLRSAQQDFTRQESKLESIAVRLQVWESAGRLRLEELGLLLDQENYAPEARALLAEIDSELRAIGYDPLLHDQVRQSELTSRAADEEMRALEIARAAYDPLAREVGELEEQTAQLSSSIAGQQAEYDQAAAAYVTALDQAPDLPGNERALLALQEQENAMRQETGAAHQLVAVLADLKTRRTHLESERAEQARQSGLYLQLERAFSKDGVPALLIEQALPQIEEKANEVLERLTGGNMAVSFATQAEYKDKRRDDLKETLDIRIRDGAGTRDYEMFSGGEAFRVNFAIRLALSEVLAQRAGARLQMLVVDEGFGSQDAEGRQRLIEALNLVRKDFSKILVITHIDELKESFPARIEVDKTINGSRVRVTY